MSELWTAISTGMTQLMTIVGSVGTAIISNTLFQVIFTVSIAFVAVKLFRRLVRVR